MTLQPLNGHVQVQPLPHETFMASAKDSYEEIGIVLSLANDVPVLYVDKDEVDTLGLGDKVYFDSWMCAKYPTGVKEEFYWLVPYSSIRAYERN